MKLCSIGGKGKGYVASKDVGEGVVLLRERPFSHSIDWRFRFHVCFHCLQVGGQPLEAVCEKCKCVAFCSIECQHQGQLNHSCAVLERMVKEQEMLPFASDADEMTFLSHMLIIEDKILDQKAAKKEFRDLVASPPGEVDERTAMMWMFTGGILNMARTGDVEEADSDDEGVYPDCAELFDEDCRREECNTISLTAITKQGNALCIGRALYLQGSRFNHSCRPNVGRFRSGTELTFLTLRPIQKGEEFCITYTDLSQSRVIRQAQLSQSYFFSCSCQRCANDEPPPNLCKQCRGLVTVHGLCLNHHTEKLLLSINF